MKPVAAAPLSMRRPLQLLAAAVCGLGVLLAVAVLLLPLLLNAAFVTQHLQARVAAAFGLDLEIGGGVDADLFPSLQFTLNYLRFTRDGSAVATVRQVRVGLDLLPLLRRQVRVDSVVLREPVIRLERYADGSYNVRKPEPRVTLSLALVQVENATFHYNDAVLGTRYEARACNLDLQAPRPLTRDSLDHLTDLDLAAKFGCAELRKDALTLSDLSVSTLGQAGVIRFDPVSMRMFGAQGAGWVHADFNGAVPLYRLHYSLPQFRIDDLFRMLVPPVPAEGLPVEGALAEGALVEGLMDFGTELTMLGQTPLSAPRTLSGYIRLRGANLVVNGTDLDEKIARFESSQHFNLVDAGAFLLVGPLGLALTKGYNFASIFTGSGTSSEIRTLVSDWDLAEGVAEADYVMLTTRANRIALKGGLDLADQQYNNVTIALLDGAGCVRIEQALQGPFRNPVVEKPNVLRSLAGPVRALLLKLVPPEPCVPFHAPAWEQQAL